MKFLSLQTAYICSGLALVLSSAMAEPLASETFDLPPASPLSSTTPATGWSTGWMANLDLSEALPAEYEVTEGSLNSPAFRAHGMEPAGGRFQSPNSAENTLIVRGLGEPIRWDQNAEIYVSFLASFSGSHPSNSSRIQLDLGEETAEGPKVGTAYIALHGDGSQDSMRLAVRNQNETSFASDSLPAGDIYFVVARIRAVPGGEPDVLEAVVYSSDAEVPSSPPENWGAKAEWARGGQATFLALTMQVYVNSRDVAFDELRIGDTWESVTAASR